MLASQDSEEPDCFPWCDVNPVGLAGREAGLL
jgi:hypothetical protein